MANRKKDQTITAVSKLVEHVSTTATKLVQRPTYQIVAGERKQIAPGKSQVVPYEYYRMTNIESPTDLHNAIDAVLNLAFSDDVEDFCEAINLGIDQWGRRQLSAGVPSGLPKALRKTLTRVLGLLEDGLVEPDLACEILRQAGIEKPETYIN